MKNLNRADATAELDWTIGKFADFLSFLSTQPFGVNLSFDAMVRVRPTHVRLAASAHESALAWGHEGI